MRAVPIALLLALSVSPAELPAQVFKCKEADGTLTYSQTPCATEDAAAVKVSTAATEPPDCSYANKFAFATARTMQGGMSSAEIFRGYGGVDAMSNSSLGIINYVYSFRTASDVSAERIAGLAQAKCEARNFGDVNCEALPPTFVEGLGGCDAEDGAGSTEAPTSAAALGMASGAQANANGSRAAKSAPSTSRSVVGSDRSKELTEQCKQRYRDQIDAIDAQMRQGYTSDQGEAYRQRLRGLTEKLRAC